MSPACRLYVLPAASAPVALVLRRGPTDWWHLLHWDLAALTLTPGAWFHGTLYPHRCNISADGRLFGYFAMKMTGGGSPEWPYAYFAVSKAPWLEALAAWKTCGTWTWGCRFSDNGELSVEGCVEPQPFHGSYPHPVTMPGMTADWPKRDVSNELKRGWEIDTTEPDLVVRRGRLGVIHHGFDFNKRGLEGAQLEYFLQDTPEDVAPLPQADWADWDYQGRLLMATREGTLEVCEWRGGRLGVLWSQDLRDRTPDPQPAPGWASHW